MKVVALERRLYCLLCRRGWPSVNGLKQWHFQLHRSVIVFGLKVSRLSQSAVEVSLIVSCHVLDLSDLRRLEAILGVNEVVATWRERHLRD